MHFTPFETASLIRLGLVQVPEDGTFTHKYFTFVASCIPTGFVDGKVITVYELEDAGFVYNFNAFKQLLTALQDILAEEK